MLKNINNAAVVLALCLCSSAFSATDKIIYAAPTVIPSAICYIAGVKGFFKDEGLDVEEKIFSSGRDALQALISGQAQLRSGSETPVVHAIIQGNDVVTIASISSNHEVGFVARTDHGILKAENLKGKKIATAAGTNSDYFMYLLLKKHNITPSEVQITNMKDPDMKVALINGDIDAYFSREPYLYYAKKELGDKAKIFKPGDLYFGRQLVNMNREFVMKNPLIVKKIIRALLKAEAFIEKNPSEAKKIVAEKLKIDPGEIDLMWKDINFKVELDKDLPRLLSEIGKWSMEVNKVKGAMPDFKKTIYANALKDEKKSSVEIE